MTDCPLTTEALTAFLVARIRPDLKQKPDGSLPGKRAIDAAFDTVTVLLHDHLNQLKTKLTAAQAEYARRLAVLNDCELGDDARRVVALHRGSS